MSSAFTVPANGANIPALGLGTYNATGEACTKAVAAALACGYRHIDTARMYGNEAEVGEGLRASGVKRDAVFITTKIWHDEQNAGVLERAAEDSLKRLGLDQVDLLLIHWPNAAVPLKESIGALCKVRAQKLAKNIGVSNFPVAMLEEASSLATEPLVADQCEYHPRLDQAKILAACRKHGMALISYCPLGRGDLVNDPAIGEIARRIGRTPSQIVLRWHVQQPGVVAIPKSKTPKHIEENFGIFDFALSQTDMAAISGLHRANGRLVRPGFAPAFD